MRGFIISSGGPDDIGHIRHLLAAEGYVELGMYEEAEEELHEVDARWFVFQETLALQLRICAGLQQWKKAHDVATLLDQSQN